MNKSKIFMGVGSLVLASAAMLAAKPAKRATISGRLVGVPAVNGAVVSPLQTKNSATTDYFTTSISGAFTVRLKTIFGFTLATLKTNVSGTANLYYHP